MNRIPRAMGKLNKRPLNVPDPAQYRQLILICHRFSKSVYTIAPIKTSVHIRTEGRKGQRQEKDNNLKGN